jgi:hypothetical protein
MSDRALSLVLKNAFELANGRFSIFAILAALSGTRPDASSNRQ